MLQALKNRLAGDLSKYKSIPFWSWNNFLDEEALMKQIEDMHEAGIGGFIMHARTGLKEEYLGEKWFSCIGACLKKAKELGMEAWIYDENGWPSGFVGGKLLEEEGYRARFLEYAVGAFDESAYACFIQDERKGYVRVEAPCEGILEYHNVYLRISPANTDILNPDVVDAFIRETHEKYYARFKESFGRELVGFFTDEPQFYRWATPYTPMLEGVVEGLRDGLIWLFVQDERGYPFRQKYYRTLNDLYVDVFYKRLYEWCKGHGVKLTGHSVEEPYLFTQMYGGAAVMPSYEYEDIPGIDSLERQNMTEISPRQVASVSAQLGKELILTEIYGCSGNDTTPREMRSIAESQYFLGVNKMCQHLYPYSLAGKGKYDCPPVFGAHSNWLKQFKTFNEYFNKLGFIIGNTTEKVNIALLHPMGEVWLDYIRTLDEQSVADVERAFSELLCALRKRGVAYHFLDERILDRHGEAEGTQLRVGACVYDTLIIPAMRNIRKSTLEKLVEYHGKLCILGDLQYVDGEEATIPLKANCSLEELLGVETGFYCADGNSFMAARAGDIGDFLFVKNNSMTEKSHVVLRGIAEKYCALDLENLSERNITNDLILSPKESLILIRSKNAVSKWEDGIKRSITTRFHTVGISPNYLLLDYAQISKDGAHFSESYPVVGHMEELIRADYKGELFVRQRFFIKETMPLTLIMERAKFKSATLNGKSLTFTQNDMDVNFMETALDDLLRVGENELVYAIDFWQHEGVRFALFDPLATESLRNCLYYDTSIEPIYIKGDFTVNEDGFLSKRIGLPPVTERLYEKGYPFFRGTLDLEGTLVWDGETKTTLGIDGRFMAAELYINGKEEEFTLTEEKEITSLLKKGENLIKIRLHSSNRNLFGPHHFQAKDDCFGVSPYHYEFRGGWQDGKYPPQFSKAYRSVPFGVKDVYVVEK